MTQNRWWMVGGAAALILVAVTITLWSLRDPAPLRVRFDFADRGAALKTVTVYYVLPDSMGLVPREREVLVGSTRQVLARELVAYLSESTGTYRSALPPGTRLLHYFEDGDEAVFDLSAEVGSLTASGIEEERLFLSAFTRTLAENLQGIRRVRLLTLGRPLERWGGHLKPGQVLEVSS